MDGRTPTTVEEAPAPELREVADRVYAWIQPDGSWFLNNTGIVVGTSRVLCIDTCSTERRTVAYLDQVEAVAGPLPRLLVNTHHHGDHTNGNCFFPATAVLAHEGCRREMLDAGILRFEGIFDPVDWGALTPAPPFLTFRDRMDVWVDELRVELRHLGPAHTTNDVIVWIPERKVLFTGDLVFNGVTPLVLQGSVAGWLEALDQLSGFEADVLVPGHGPPCDLRAIDQVGAYLRFLQQLAERACEQGITPLAAARGADLGSHRSLRDPERIVGNLHRAMAEHRGIRDGAAIDYRSAFADMLELNGNRPLRCLA